MGELALGVIPLGILTLCAHGAAQNWWCLPEQCWSWWADGGARPAGTFARDQRCRERANIGWVVELLVGGKLLLWGCGFLAGRMHGVGAAWPNSAAWHAGSWSRSGTGAVSVVKEERDM